MPAICSSFALDLHYDAEVQLIRCAFHSPGYHSRLPNGTQVHPLRQSLDYALQCLDCGDAAHQERAADVIDRVCSLQDTDPIRDTYGIWAWTYEEPLEQMDPPDWNWADFIGVRLAHALRQYRAELPASTVQRAQTALSRAAWSIFRRNVDAGYTNIAIMGSVVMAAAGELLGVPFWTDYARRRLASIERSVEAHGSFNEYNSPTYTMVAVEELDRLHLLVEDAACRASAQNLWRHAWQVIAGHFHPTTQQWAGPCARAYGDYLSRPTCRWLSEATGVEVLPAEAAAGEPDCPDGYRTPPRPCPADLRGRFQSLPEPDVSLRQTFIRRPEGDTVGTTWMNAAACLGSVSHDDTWAQRRPLLAYWRTAADVAMLKMVVLLNGREFPGFLVRQAQAGPRVLTAFRPLYGTGDFHPSLGSRPDGRFDVSDLRIRYLLRSAEADLDAEGDRLKLVAGPWRAVLCPADVCTFNDSPVTWTACRCDGGVHVDGVIHHGSARVIDFTKAHMRVAVGLELQPVGTHRLPTPETRVDEEGRLHADWLGLDVCTPTHSAGPERT